MPKRRVGYLTNQYPKASHSFIRREIRALEELGWEVERYTMRIPHDEIVDAEDKQEAARTMSLVEAGMKAVGSTLARTALTRPADFARGLRGALRLARRSDVSLQRHLIYLAEASLLVQWARRDNIGHIHTHFGTNSAEVALLCELLDGPTYSLTIHGPEEFDRAPLLGIADKICHAQFVATVSSFGRSQACRLVPTHVWPRIHVVHCGLDDGWFEGEPEPIKNRKNLVCVARLSEQKGHGILLAALREVAATGREFSMKLIGDGELRADVERLISEYGLIDQVEITGWCSEDEVKEAIANSIGFVLPSFAEGLPVVIMEALAAGRPVISTYVAGIPELVRPGESGWLVPAGSVDELVTAICELLDSPVEQLDRLGQSGRVAVAARHRATTEAGKLDRLFREALADDNCRGASSVRGHATRVP